MLYPNIGKLVVKRQEQSNTTPGGLHIPDSAREREATWKGEVIASAADEEHKLAQAKGEIDFCFAVGVVVLCRLHAGIDVKDKGETYTIIDKADVLAVVS